MKKYIIGLAVVMAQFAISDVNKLYAQESIGMSTGNYAGITSVWFNPANIADSRYKFDINIIGINSSFNNNYLLVKNGTFVRRLLHKEPYSSSYTDVKKDLLQQNYLGNRKVFANVESNIHFPLSFMITTGKRSAIAFTMNNRTINKVNNLNPEMAGLLFNELGDPVLNGKNIRMDSVQYNFLNWQEIGFTYSRVMLRTNHHFIKMGATVKWLGASAGAYFQTDNAVVNFKNNHTMSLSSPLIHYARTANADLGQFARRDILNNLEDQTFGWDAGLVYEFRAKVKKFKYVDEDLKEEQRRDLNKYMFRIGLSLVDVGRFTLNKKPLTNDHSANFVNWDFSGVKANNISQFDTAYSKKVNYVAGASSTFTYRLPAALIANFDLHLFGGFYVNVAAKAPFESFKKTSDTYVEADKWIAFTPRFESRFLGIYVPVTHYNKQTYIGGTLKFGPIYLGSNNLSQLLTNPTSYGADFHAGARLSIPYGKPKMNKNIENLLYGKSVSQSQLDSLKREVDGLKRSLYDSSRMRPVQVIINNNGVTSEVDSRNSDSVVIRNKTSQEQQRQQEAYNRQQETNTDTLVRQLAKSNLELEKMKLQANENEQTGKTKGSKKYRKASKESTKVEVSNKEMEQEMERIRKQMQIQNAAIIGGGTAAVVASSSNKKDKNGNEVAMKKDSLAKDTNGVILATIPVQKTDTIYIRDTVKVNNDVVADNAAFHLVNDEKFPPILFANGSAAISAADKKRLQQLADEIKKHDNWRLEVTGMTDANGSVQANRKMAAKRTGAVSNILLQNGVKDSQIIYRSKLADTNNIPATENPRRIEIRVLSKK